MRDKYGRKKNKKNRSLWNFAVVIYIYVCRLHKLSLEFDQLRYPRLSWGFRGVSQLSGRVLFHDSAQKKK